MSTTTEAVRATPEGNAGTAPMSSDDEIMALVGIVRPGAVPGRVLDTPEGAEEPDTTEDDTPEAEVTTEEAPAAAAVVSSPSTPADDAIYRIPVDGVEQEVKWADIKQGISGQQKITKGLQEAAVMRQQAEAKAQLYDAELTKTAERLDLLTKTLEAQKPHEPDPTTLTPDEYLRQRAEHVAAEDRLAKFKAAQQKVADEQERVRAEQRQAFVRQEAARLVEAIPEWRDEAKYTAESTALGTYLKGLGFADQEVAGIVDHRAVLVARKAMLYDQLQEKTKTTVSQAVAKAPVMQPGSSQPAKKPLSKVEEARKRFTKTGSTRDAEALMIAKIEAGEF